VVKNFETIYYTYTTLPLLSEDFVKKIVISVGLMLPSANCGGGGGEGAAREK